VGIAIDLSDQQARDLAEVARQLQISPVELATAAVRDLVAPHSSDFLHAAERVLAKNHDLYRRLA
jgi:hypothetical protein